MANEKPKEPQAEFAPLAVPNPAPLPPTEILSQSAMEILAKATSADLIAPVPGDEVVRARAHRSGGWLHSPAMLELFASATKRLTRVANMPGMNLNLKRVERVHARLIAGSKLVVLKPAPDTDLSALPVHRYAGQSSAYINLISLLGPKNLTVEPGWRERFDIAYVPSGFAVGPGLVFDLTTPVERRQETKKKDGEEAAPAKTAKARKTAPKAPAAEAAAGAAPPPAATPAEPDPTKNEEGAGQE